MRYVSAGENVMLAPGWHSRAYADAVSPLGLAPQQDDPKLEAAIRSRRRLVPTMGGVLDGRAPGQPGA
jgi:hypothetical protein